VAHPRENDEQAMVRDTVRSMLGRINPLAEVRAGTGGQRGYTESNWAQFTEQLGAGGALIPEALGGLGLRFGDVCTILEETGAACYNGPFLASAVLTALVLLAADHDTTNDQRELATGSFTGAVTTLHHGADPDSWPTEVEATIAPDGSAILRGTAAAVMQGIGADVLYVVAENADRGTGIWAVDAGAAGHTMRALETLDLTRAHSEHTFDATPARPVLSPSTDRARLRNIAALATIALSAEQLGAAGHQFATTLDYARTRYQFGRAIGSFQTIKHRCVDMSIALEGATSVHHHARDAADVRDLTETLTSSDWALLHAAALAGVWVSQTTVQIAHASLQIHGGIGMAWEHETHLYVRRAKATEHLFGTPTQHRKALLSLL
jgi:alkylation response protein AidB-like acyl-CoA dehydrogenase